MEILISVLSTLANILVAGVVLYTSTKFLGCSIPYVYALPAYQAFGLAFCLVSVYNVVLYPMLLDPLRVFPRVVAPDIRVLLPVTDAPRGESALRWVKQHPSADAIRISTPVGSVLTAVSPRALRDALATNQNDYEKPLSGRNFLARTLGWGLILSEGATHDRQRKHLTSSFRIQNIRGLHELMLSKTRIMMQEMEKQCTLTGKCEMNSWGSKVTLDIIGNSLMYKDFDALRTEHQPVNEAFEELTAVSPDTTIHYLLSFVLPGFILSRLPTATNRLVDRNSQVIINACAEGLDAAIADNKVVQGHGSKQQRGSEILQSILSDSQTTRTEIIDQMRTFLGAGHETTATSIAWATHILTLPDYQHYQTRLRAELDATGFHTAISDPQVLEKLPWLNAICEETLRLYPPVTTTGRIAIRDTTIAGARVPKGTLVVLFPWAVNRNPRYWGGLDSERFVPERWLDTRPDGSVRLNKHGGAESNFCELTFLHGNRGCIGRDFSKAELRVILASFFGQFEVARLPGDDLVAEPVGSLTIKPKGGLFVKLRRVRDG
ncbi:hypothetical protein PRZ48_006685 [Zasmidium cellare]|uniref:Cytochrome P450 n=1 Tax=Zasmidium cellare TaxID=395010 RepID=A0ABR0EP63_ZASCE|nr:hypothetical protein PRZ48_006685 [Zasmidium cellare]